MPLTKEQITYIRDRIDQQGIHNAALLNDLLDHICCAVEDEMKHALSFEVALDKAINDFCPEGGFVDMQTQINDISSNKTITMKKLIFILTLLLSVSFFGCIFLNGIRLLNNYNWAFVSDLAFINQYAFCLFLLPLYWFHQYKMAINGPHDGLREGTKILMFTLGFLCSEALANAVFFKLMHMPGGNQLFIITAVLGIAYMPLLLFRKYRLEF